MRWIRLPPQELRARFYWFPGRTSSPGPSEVIMGYSAGMSAIIGAVTMLVCFMLDLHLIISIPICLGIMGFCLLKVDNFSKRKQDQRLMLPPEEPPNVNY